MNANVGNADRLVRAVAGTLLILLALLTDLLAEPAWMPWAAVAVGAVLVLTAAASFCPLYRLVGVRTCRLRR